MLGIYGALTIVPSFFLGQLVDSPYMIAAKINNQKERAHWKQIGID